VCDKVRERENGQGRWVHGGDQVGGMVMALGVCGVFLWSLVLGLVE
jgi:hypothetical protein